MTDAKAPEDAEPAYEFDHDPDAEDPGDDAEHCNDMMTGGPGGDQQCGTGSPMSPRAAARLTDDPVVGIWPWGDGERVTLSAAKLEGDIRKLVPHSQPKVFFDSAEIPQLSGPVAPEERRLIAATCSFFARLGTKDKKKLCVEAGHDCMQLRRMSVCTYSSQDEDAPKCDSKTAVDLDLCKWWNEQAYLDRRKTAQALASWKKGEGSGEKWNLCGGSDPESMQLKNALLRPPDERKPAAQTQVQFCRAQPIFVRFTDRDPAVRSAHARTLVQNLNHKQLAGQKVQADMAFTMRNLLAITGRQKFQSMDLIDRHALDKALMWVWTNRDELVPDTIQQEFTKDHWDNAWRQVLAGNLRCTQDSAWIAAFTYAFPDTGPRNSSLHRLEPLDPLVCLTGRPSDPRRGAWLGEQQVLGPVKPLPLPASEADLPEECQDPHYTYGHHVGGCLQQYETTLISEATKILSEVFTSLDADGGGRIDRSELNDFFSSVRDSQGLRRPTWRGHPEWDDYYHEHLLTDEQRQKLVTVKAEEQKIKMDADRDKEQDELRLRTTSMKEKLFEDQKRACCLNMTDTQFKLLLKALMKADTKGGDDFDAPNFWLSDADFPHELEDQLLQEERDRHVAIEVHVNIGDLRELTVPLFLRRLGITLHKGTNIVKKVMKPGDRLADAQTPGDEPMAGGEEELGPEDLTVYKEMANREGTLGTDRVLPGWQLHTVGHSRIFGHRRKEMRMPEHCIQRALERDARGAERVRCVFREHLAYSVVEGVPPAPLEEQPEVTVLQQRARRRSQQTQDESKIIERYIIRGEFDKISFGLPEKILDRLNIPDPELVRAAGFIVSREDRDRLELKAKETGISKAAQNLIFGTMIDQQEFKDAYKAAVGVDLDSDEYSHVWDHISGKFGGMIDKEIFFRFARTEAAEPVHPGVGGSYYIDYCQEQKRIINLEQNLFLFTCFLLCFALQIVMDQAIGEANYQALALQETIIQEIGGGQNHADGGTWYAWYFKDIRQLEEWWQWTDMVLDLAYVDSATGIQRKWENSNQLVGALKLQQWRVRPERCKGLPEMFDNDIVDACYRSVDAARVTDGLIVSGQSQASTYPWIARSAQTYMTNFLLEPTTCFRSRRPAAFPQNVRVAVQSADRSRVALEVFKWLAEEKLNVRVEVLERTAAQALQGLLDGTVDVVLDIWDIFDIDLGALSVQVRAALASGSIRNGGSVGYKGDDAVWINSAAVAACPGCTRWETFKAQGAAFTTGCANACRHACSRCGLSYQATLTAAGDCYTCPPSLLAATNTDYNATQAKQCVSTATSCGAGKGAIWDVHPGLEKPTLGPELFRSSSLGLSAKFELVYSVTEAALRQQVLGASAPMAFVLDAPDDAIRKSGAVRVAFPDYSLASCPTPDPAPNDPAMGTKFDCDFPRQDVVKLYRGSLANGLPQIVWLVEAFSMKAADINGMLESMDTNFWGYSRVACDWLKSKPGRWDDWVRRTRPALAAERREQFFEQCFPSWAGEIDENSFSDNARFLVPLQALQEDSPEGLTGNCTGDWRVLPGRACQKVLRAPSGDPVDNLVVPSVEEYEQLGIEALGGNLTAERMHGRLKPWMYTRCTHFVAIQGKMGTVHQPVPRQQYECPGYQAHFPVSWTRERAKRQMDELSKNNWIDAATRAVMVELFTFNQNTLEIIRARYLAEIASGGGFEMSHHKTTFRLWQWESKGTAGKIGTIALIVTTLGFTIYFTFQTVSEMRERWKWHVRDRRAIDASAGHNAWRPVFTYGLPKIVQIAMFLVGGAGDMCDVANYVLMYITWSMRFYLMALGLTVENLLCTDVYQEDLNAVADLAFLISTFDGVNAILVVLRLLFFLSIFASVKQILGTIMKAAEDIAWLLVTFIIIVIGFSLCSYVVFGDSVPRYNGIGQSFVSLIFLTNGEFDYFALDDERPGFAFFYFFFFFVLVVCILLNLIIAVIGNAYDSVKLTFFDTAGFMERVRHDPETASWAPDGATGLSAWLRFGVVTRELRYQWFRCVYRWHLCTRGKCVSEKGVCGRLNMTRSLQQNPRIFWAEYLKLMEGLSSDNFCDFLRAHTMLRMLVKNNKVQQSIPECPYQVGDSVWVRDNDDDEWLKGEVMALDGASPLVLPTGWDASRAQRDEDDDGEEAGHFHRVGYEWQYVVVDDHDYSQGEHVMLCQDVSFNDELEVLGDTAAGTGALRVKAKLLKGTLLVIEKVMPSPIAGKPVWQQGWKARVRVLGALTRDWHERAGTTWEMAGRRGKTEGIDRALALDQAVFVVDRTHIQTMGVRLDRRDDEVVESADVQLLRVNSLLIEELHEQLDEIGFFLVTIPQKVLGGNLTRSWIELLTHFHFWKNKVKAYTKLDKGSEDLIEETHAWCRDRFSELAEDINHIRHGAGRVKSGVTAEARCGSIPGVTRSLARFRDELLGTHAAEGKKLPQLQDLRRRILDDFREELARRSGQPQSQLG